jgi:hypothetical protein
LLAFLILVPTLDAQSIWWDEGISLHLAGLPWQDILQNRAANIHPPLYFLLLKTWTLLAGTTPFAARYLSTLAAVLLPALVYRFMARRFGRRAARASAFLTALPPPMIVYGQEVRAYALLMPLTLLLLGRIWPPPKSAVRGAGSSSARSRFRRYGALALIQASLILLHYAGVIAVALAQLVLAVRWMVSRRRDRRDGWLVSAGLTVALLLPWAIFVYLTGLQGLSRQAGLGNALADAVPAGYVARLLAIFHLFGLPGALDAVWLRRAAWVTGALLGLVLLWAPARRPVRRRDRLAPLLLAWLLPFSSAPLIWTLSPQSHPRYLFPFILGGWLLIAVLVTRRTVPKMLRLVLLAAVLVAALLGGQAYLVNPRFARSDIRGVANFVRARAAPGDAVFVPHTDWSLAQYGVGAAQIVMIPLPARDAEVSATVARHALAGRTVYALDYRRGALDPRGQVRAALTWGGVLTARHTFHGAFLDVYEMTSGAGVDPCEAQSPVCIEGGDLCLTGSSAQSAPVSGSAVPLHLCWRGVEMGRYAAVLGLTAPGGALVAETSDLLLNEAGEPTDLWRGGPVSTYHVLPLPVGAPPLAHTLTLGVYDVEDPDQPVVWALPGAAPRATVPLGVTKPVTTPWRETSAYGVPSGPTSPAAPLGSALRLEGAVVDREVVFPGQAVFVTARWRVVGPVDASHRPRYVLRQGARDLAIVGSPALLADLPVGRPLLEKLPLAVPPQAEAGEAQAVLAVGDREIVVGDLVIEGGAHRFVPPPVAHASGARAGDVATLVGFDLAPDAVTAHDSVTVDAGAPLTVTLVWRAGPKAAAADLKVFVHLVSSSGAIIAQHDASPAAWTRPTPGWVPEEIVVDVHPLTWQATDAAGPADLVVGFYDPETGERVVWDSGDDALVLQVPVVVGSE